MLPEEAGDFDREYRQAMTEATESLDLTPVLGVLRRWRRVAWSSRDVDAHRRMLSRAEQIAAGDLESAVSWEQSRRRWGL